MRSEGPGQAGSVRWLTGMGVSRENPGHHHQHDYMEGIMTKYRDIDDLLLTTNKGVLSAGGSKDGAAAIPRPGDGVVVSFVDRDLRDILIHYVDPSNTICKGEARAGVFDREGHEILGKAEYVQFSYKKIAGIHRQ